MIAHQIMCQLMAQNHPPINNSVRTIRWVFQKPLLLQHLEVEVVAEDTSRPVECDRLTARIIEDAQTVGSHRKDRTTVQEDCSEDVESCVVGGEEGGAVSDGFGEKNVDIALR